MTSSPTDGPPQQWRPPAGPAHDGMQMPPPEPGSFRTVLVDEPTPSITPQKKSNKGVIIALVVVVFVGLSLLVADWVARNVEMNQLLTQIEKSEAAMVAAQEAIGEVELGGGGGDPPGDLGEDSLADATAQLEEAAADGRDAVARAGEDVAEVSFLPWHSSLITAQAAYLDHNQAWVNYLDAGARNAASLGNSPADIETTWRIAELRVREAIPMVPFPGINSRVDQIFKDGDEESSGPTITA